ncbi:hypothetical protein [Burkholderia ubonensis]|uniref:Uncharacterized protein n=1 Tax=Burkholderia ubonensis TaxID=101571 RepID=A0A117XPX8_9BURK|nr:hypothetical protein [Burkholderia ubonensis]KUZ78718.1 hypothetical protein WI35_04120 [Burkholderia ubonensis]KUZ87557.1 hypothetical protein WI39_24320 [Burkholderia ubonensis]KUZ91654.1 hypothetical protein WI38_13030 [Burkholderia ubonensis]KVA14654.1 hypothetical protein WI42_02470 [Burkholderia ubonensis]KVA25288.1 hypothetical protein WI43_09250 [Burkholderia ubonensis]
MIQVQDPKTTDIPTADLVLSLSLPAGTDPAIVSSLKRGLEDLVAAVLTTTPFEEVVIQRADDLAAAITGLSAPAAPLIEERIRRQETMRAVFARGDWLTAEQINALQTRSPANRAQPASDWRRHGRIFSVSIGGKEYFAAYQFDATCQPLPIIKEILEALGPVADPWKIAAWFHFQNGWISGTGDREGQPVAPMDALDRREILINAAKQMQGTHIA